MRSAWRLPVVIASNALRYAVREVGWKTIGAKFFSESRRVKSSFIRSLLIRGGMSTVSGKGVGSCDHLVFPEVGSGILVLFSVVVATDGLLFSVFS